MRHEPTARKLKIGKKPHTYRLLQLLTIFYYLVFPIFRVQYILYNMLRIIESTDNVVVHIVKWVKIYSAWWIIRNVCHKFDVILFNMNFIYHGRFIEYCVQLSGFFTLSLLIYWWYTRLQLIIVYWYIYIHILIYWQLIANQCTYIHCQSIHTLILH